MSEKSFSHHSFADTRRPKHSYGADPERFPDPAAPHSITEYSIEDEVLVPADLPAGEYVLGWRWDCEMTSQARCP